MKYEKKYKDIYTGKPYLHKDNEGKWTKRVGNYGNGGGWKSLLTYVKNYVNKNPGCNILDYGCGQAVHWHANVNMTIDGQKVSKTMMQYLHRNVSGFFRYDPCHPVYNKRPTGKFDCVVATDVVEHIPKEELPYVLQHIDDCTAHDGKVFFTIPDTESQGHFMDGENMHCTIMEKEKWMWLIKKYLKKDFQIIWKITER